MTDMAEKTENRYESSPERPFNGRVQLTTDGYTKHVDFEQKSTGLYISICRDGSIIAKERALDFAADMQAMRN